MQKIEITINGDVEHDIGEYIPHATYKQFVKRYFRELYPDADISISGDADTVGGDNAEMFEVVTDDDGDETEVTRDLSADLTACYVAAFTEDDLWVSRK